MNKTLLTIAIIMDLAAIYLLFFHLPQNRSEIEKKAVKGYGTVQFKDEQATPDGRASYTVSFTYQDDQNKNQLATNQISNGDYENLKPKQDIKIMFVPGKPGQAYLNGAVAIILQNEDGSSGGDPIIITAPHSTAFRYLAWTLLLFSFPVYYFSWSTAANAVKRKGRGAIITHRS